MKKNILVSLGLIVLIVLGRLLPHMPNATPVTAVALAAAVYLKGINRWLIPLTGMLIADVVIGFYALPIMLSVYASFTGVYLIGLYIQKHRSMLMVIAGTLASSLLFFLLTNFAVWAFGTWYDHSVGGLLYCYTLALPFFRSMVVGDIIYTTVVFGICEFGRLYKPFPRLQNAVR